MSNDTYILDCTLRDGGYCNNWEFGVENKKKIVKGLLTSDVDIIECGLLSKGNFSQEQTKYSNLQEISNYLPIEKDENKLFVVLMNYGDFDVSTIPECGSTGIDGIRVAFHKKDAKEAIRQMKQIKEKKYKVFMQPMVTVTYSKEEYEDLIEAANELEPYAFYIVDSFGSMKADELNNYCELANRALKDSIILGFHSHNNLQLAYSNAQLFEKETRKRTTIIDCCIMGMGRGAGNLNTELFLDYMNLKCDKLYKIEPILVLIDEIINFFYQKKYWGYSLPNYLSASHNMHPNYGTFLSNKNTLTISMMSELLSLVNIGKKNSFDQEYIEDLYVSYMSANGLKNKALISLRNVFEKKEVLLIAPGKSIDTEFGKIREFLNKKNVIVVSINFEISYADYIFVSNPKRYDELEIIDNSKLIVTSNVSTDGKCTIVDYIELLCDEDYVRDNATMMLIKLLINSGTRKIYLAGVDGYSGDSENNYTKLSSALVTSSEYMKQMNIGMNNMLHRYLHEIDIQFVTTEKKIRR